jgi:DNA primase
MDENAHKALLDQPGAPRRWINTSPEGCLAEWVVLIEGGIARFALLAAGFPANVVIALVGTAARPTWLVRLAPQVKSVVLALDADDGGAVAMERLAEAFRQAGFTVILCSPPHDQWGKDWCERCRRLGPQSIWPLYEAFTQHCTSIDERKES